jgi:hypothetical protein
MGDMLAATAKELYAHTSTTHFGTAGDGGSVPSECGFPMPSIRSGATTLD